jgi:hypothetical protein
MKPMNNFRNDLAFSHACEEMDCWREIYSLAFPTMSAMVDHRQDGQHQRAGIDRTIVLANGKSITVDEKVRRKDYGDVLLEYISNDRTQSPGWIEKHLLCDFIAYAVLPTGKAYLLPVIQLQIAWQKNKESWMDMATSKRNGYRLCSAKNDYYNTQSISVPVRDLFAAIGSALRVDFTPLNEGSYEQLELPVF